ncbi:MAG: leucine-rich repeat domain-containing protein, partial [Cytophagales bacterium]|nr:leucine-rich repeat domain-containing protein [Cytophagales bacterium]
MKTNLSFALLACLALQFTSLSTSGQLSIGNTQFKTIKAAFAHRDEASWLDLSGQGLTELPDSLFALISIQYLDLSKNHLESIPARIKELKKLKYLVLSYNEIKQLPGEIKELKLLQSLY